MPADIKRYLGYAAVVLAALFLGKWYSMERDKLLRRGEPWIKSWTTLPGLIILTILAILIGVKLYTGF